MNSAANKTTAAVMAGALCTLIVFAWNGMVKTFPLTPEVQGALQTLITAAVVYFGPANKAA